MATVPRAYAYCRVSHDESANSGLGIAAQRTTCTNYFASDQRRNLYPDHEWSRVGWLGRKHYGAYTDDGFFVDQSVSAFKTPFKKRPAGAKLNGILDRGDLIIIPYLSRAFRSLGDFAELTAAWRERGVKCFFCDLPIDMDSPIGRAMAGNLAVFAQLHSDLVSVATREAFAEKKKRGESLGARVGPGRKRIHRWSPDKGRRRTFDVIDEEQRPILERIRELRNSGHSWWSICDNIEQWLSSSLGRPYISRIGRRTGHSSWESRPWSMERCRRGYFALEKIEAEEAARIEEIKAASGASSAVVGEGE